MYLSAPKKLLLFAMLLAAFVLASFGSAAAAELPEIDAAAYVLMEPQSGEILAAANADAKRYPASTTKIMTLVLALEAVEGGEASLEDNVTTSEYAAGMGG